MQIDLDPMRIGLRYPVEVGLVGDSRRDAARSCCRCCSRNEDASFLEKAQEGMKEWWELMEERGTRTDKPMKPQVVAWELGKRLARRRHRLLRFRHDHHLVGAPDPGQARPDALAAPGTWPAWRRGLPYAIAAQIAYPDRQCVAFVGDGGFSMLMAEFATAVKYKLPIKVVVIKNNTLGQIKWEQMVFLGNPEYGCDLQPIDFAAFARACGGDGFHDRGSGATAARVLDEALAAPGPVVVEAVVDPYEPPMPPKVTVEAGRPVRGIAGHAASRTARRSR